MAARQRLLSGIVGANIALDGDFYCVLRTQTTISYISHRIL
jgi:hypothetical protein